MHTLLTKARAGRQDTQATKQYNCNGNPLRYVSFDMTTRRHHPTKAAICSIMLVLIAPASLWARDSAVPRIFISASETWAVEGPQGGARPQTVEVIKTFQKRCDCIVTMREDRADYVVMLDREGGKDILRRDNKYAVYEREGGDVLGSGSTRTIGNAVKDACAILTSDWRLRGRAVAAASGSN